MKYSGILVLFLILFLFLRKRKRENIIAKLQMKRGDRQKMVEFAKRFIDKDCIVYTFDNTQLVGKIKEVSENALLFEDNTNALEVVNLSFVMRIREYPRNKKGKKKVVVS